VDPKKKSRMWGWTDKNREGKGKGQKHFKVTLRTKEGKKGESLNQGERAQSMTAKG